MLIDKHEFAGKVIKYYDKYGRDFPWRRTEDPYRVLVSEILLMQTRADQVEPRYRELIKRFPTIETLSKAEEEEIGDIIDVLGLAYRKKRLKKLACVIMDKYGGKVPTKVDELLMLHGVGRYTANAVVCFAHCEARPIVDVNIARVLQLVFDLKIEGRARDNNDLWSLAQELVPKRNFRKYNWGLLDLGYMLASEDIQTKCDFFNAMS